MRELTQTLTPAEQWARYDFGVEMIRTLGTWGYEAIADRDAERTRRIAVIKMQLERFIGAPPTIDRPEPEPNGGVDLDEARKLADDIEHRGYCGDPDVLVQTIRALCDEVERRR